MAYSYNSVVMDGSTNIIAVPFPYLEQSDIHVYVSGTEVFGFSWLTSSTIQLAQTAASLAGYTVQVNRITQLGAAAVTFQSGGLDPSTLNLQTNQLLYALQENLDASQNSIATLGGVVFTAWLSSLPTSLPSVAGLWWLDGGMLARS